MSFSTDEEDERGQPLRVDLDAGGVDALAAELLEDEAAHLLVADAGDDAPTCSPSRAVPMAMLVGQPPTDLAKEAMSSSREPICLP